MKTKSKKEKAQKRAARKTEEDRIFAHFERIDQWLEGGDDSILENGMDLEISGLSGWGEWDLSEYSKRRLLH